MAQNPSLRIEEDLKTRTKFPSRTPKQHRYYIFNSPSNLDHLQYIVYQPFMGRDRFAIGTIQECKSLADAETQWETLKKYDSRYLLHPQKCMRHQRKYILLFEKLVRDFRFWKEEHANGRITDEVMWEILKKIGVNLIYLVSENRPHGNLQGGIVITTDGQPLLYNLGAQTSTIYKNDATALHKLLEEVEVKMSDNDIKKHVERWKSFLSTCCLKVKPSELSTTSVFYPLYSPMHVVVVFNYPSSWDVENKLRFLTNMYKLCTDNNQGRSHDKLINNVDFQAYLRARYSDWSACVTSEVSFLHEVYKFGFNMGQYQRQVPGTRTTVASEESIVIYADDCLRHCWDSIQAYNNNLLKQKANNNNTTNAVKLVEVEADKILAELYKKFPHLIEDIYQAFHKALAKGDYVLTHSVTDVLTGKIQ